MSWNWGGDFGNTFSIIDNFYVIPILEIQIFATILHGNEQLRILRVFCKYHWPIEWIFDVYEQIQAFYISKTAWKWPLLSQFTYNLA